MPASKPPAVVSELRRALSDELRDLTLKPGITDSLFVGVVVGCLYRYVERAERFREADEQVHRVLLNRSGLAMLQGHASGPWPWLVPHAKRALEQQVAIRAQHDERARWEKALGKYLDPVVCLYAAFRYLAAGSIDDYMQDHIPQILTLSRFAPHRAGIWTAANVSRRFRRRGGKSAADFAAYYMLSTDPRLKRYRPPAPLAPAAGVDPDLLASLIGRALFVVPTKPAPPKPSTGGQGSIESG